MDSVSTRRGAVTAVLAAAFAGTAVALERTNDAKTPEALRRTRQTRSTLYVVTEYGVRGDGATDDAAALNALLVAVELDGGGVVLFPHGVYLLRSAVVLRNGVQLTSGAPQHGYIPSDPGSTAAVLRAADGFADPFVVDTDDDGVVSAGLSGIDVRGSRNSGGVRLRKGSWCVISKSHIDGCGEQGVLIEAGFACVLEDLLTTNCVLNRQRQALTGTIDVAGTDHYLARCECNASLDAPSSSEQRVAALVLRGANHFVSDCVAELSDVGVAVAADDCRFTGVRSDTNQGTGWVVSGSGNLLSACSSIGNAQAGGDDDGFVVSGTGNGFAVCSVRTPGTLPGVRFGFRDTVNTSTVADRTTYVGCTVDRARTARWRTAEFLGSSPTFAAHPVRPEDGTVRPDVSQSTLLVLFDYRTATTITDFLNGTTGQTLRVLGSGAVTVQHGERIRTASGSDTRLVTNGVSTFTYYGGSWFEG